MGTIISYIVIGLIGGSIAKAIMKQQKTGWFSTMALGILGALLGGFLGGLLLDVRYERVFSIKGLIFSIVGAIVILIVQGWWAKRNK